jgi:hypothetical protein
LLTQQLLRSTSHYHSTCWLHESLAGTVCAIWLHVWGRDCTIYCATHQYGPYTLSNIAQPKILRNNIERLGAAVNILCKPYCAIILSV